MIGVDTLLADRYQVIEKLGQGGMATVFRALQVGLDREVAVKVLRTDTTWDENSLKRFMQEAKAIARLQHPNILAVYDFGTQDDVPFIVLPLMTGGTLKDLMKDRLPLMRVMVILDQLASAIDYAHSQGIVHRDLKPSNVLISANGDALLTDFGIAKFVNSDVTMTQTGFTFGTPDYMSPEQCLGGKVDGRSDLYSLGIIAFELLAGKVPFTADTPLGVAIKHCNEQLPSLRQFNGDLPPAYDPVLIKAAAKKPEDRYPTCRDFVQSLRSVQPAEAESALAPQPVRSVPQVAISFQSATPTPISHAGAEVVRPKVGLAGAGAIGLFLVAVVSGSIYLFRGKGAPAASAVPSETQAVPLDTRTAGTISDQEAQNIAISALERYASTLASYDLAGHMQCYAGQVEVYFDRRNVSNSSISRQKRDAMDKFNQRIDIRFFNVSAHGTSDGRVSATFDKTWDCLGDQGGFSGEIRGGTIVLARDGSAWRIVVERDGRVIRRENSPAPAAVAPEPNYEQDDPRVTSPVPPSPPAPPVTSASPSSNGENQSDASGSNANSPTPPQQPNQPMTPEEEYRAAMRRVWQR